MSGVVGVGVDCGGVAGGEGDTTGGGAGGGDAGSLTGCGDDAVDFYGVTCVESGSFRVFHAEGDFSASLAERFVGRLFLSFLKSSFGFCECNELI